MYPIIMSNEQWRIQDFPKEGAPTPRGAPTYDFAQFSQKLHEIERIWTPGGACVPYAPLDPPLISICVKSRVITCP